MANPTRNPASDSLRQALTLLLLAVAGFAGVLAESDPGPGVRGLAWLALWALPAGCLAAGFGHGAWALPLGWGCWVAFHGPGEGAHWAALVVVGLFAGGVGIGVAWPRWRWGSATMALLAGALLAALPAWGGLAGDGPWSAATAARLLDLAPTTWVVECAGVDWMRHPAVYAPAGADAIGPELRLPFRGAVAGPTLLVVGCALALAGLRRRRRQEE